MLSPSCATPRGGSALASTPGAEWRGDRALRRSRCGIRFGNGGAIRRPDSTRSAPARRRQHVLKRACGEERRAWTMDLRSRRARRCTHSFPRGRNGPSALDNRWDRPFRGRISRSDRRCRERSPARSTPRTPTVFSRAPHPAVKGVLLRDGARFRAAARAMPTRDDLRLNARAR